MILNNRINRLLILSLLIFPCLLLADEVKQSTPGNAPPSAKELKDIRTEVEMLRGKKFINEVPFRSFSKEELRDMVGVELKKQFPGDALDHYGALMARLGVIPEGADFKKVMTDLLVDQVAAFYDTETKSVHFPSFISAEKDGEFDRFDKMMDGVVLAHEFTHALEDQHWPMVDDFKNSPTSTDRDMALSCLVEGSATRMTIEALPAEAGASDSYLLMWNLLHSDVGEHVLDTLFSKVREDPELSESGAPEILKRSELAAYSHGYSFSTQILRQWGLDGLDYIYSNPPVSSEQVIHPKKSWEWRDFPVDITLDKELSGGWKQLSNHCFGEAGMAAFFGSKFQSVKMGSWAARGWDGDQAALYEGPDGHQLLVWASSWDSSFAAIAHVVTCLEERRHSNAATITERSADRHEWERPDGRQGVIIRDGKHVVLVETESGEISQIADTLMKTITFTAPGEVADRAAANPIYLRYNPLVSYRKDADYAVSKTLFGLLSRHDRNSVGGADRFLLGLGESRRTESFDKWQLGWGLLARHESEARRGTSRTSLLPWGLLVSHDSLPVLPAPNVTMTQTSVLWGWVGRHRVEKTGEQVDRRTVSLLPLGLLFSSTTGTEQTSVHVIGTGITHRKSSEKSKGITRLRILGIPVWTFGSSTLEVDS